MKLVLRKKDIFFNFSTILLAFHNKYHVAKPNQNSAFNFIQQQKIRQREILTHDD